MQKIYISWKMCKTVMIKARIDARISIESTKLRAFILVKEKKKPSGINIAVILNSAV